MPLPSELRLSSKWDTCVERMIFHVTAGVVVAGLASVVLFRKSLTPTRSLTHSLSHTMRTPHTHSMVLLSTRLIPADARYPYITAV